MTKVITSLLRRIVGRIKKMKMIREVTLLFFGILLVFALQVYKEAYDLLLSGNVENDLLLIIVLLIPLGFLIILGSAIHWIDKLDNLKQSHIMKALIVNNGLLKDLINEIRQDRNDRNNRDSKQ